MRYTYDCFKDIVRVCTTSNFQEVVKIWSTLEITSVVVHDNIGSGQTVLASYDALCEWEQSLERAAQWKPTPRWNPTSNLLDDHVTPKNVLLPKDPVDPQHYKNYIEDLQWIDAMRRIPTLREPSKFVACLEIMLRKYIDRNGQKDPSVQELKKARFYLEYMIQYLEGKDPKAEDVHNKLKD